MDESIGLLKPCPACEQEKPQEDFSHTGFCKECEKTRLDALSLQRECQCCTHIGPHWLHMDYLDRERNLELLERALNYAKDRNAMATDRLIAAFFRNEQMRITNKRRHMRDGITYSYALVGEQVNLDARELTLLKALFQIGNQIENEWKARHMKSESIIDSTKTWSGLTAPDGWHIVGSICHPETGQRCGHAWQRMTGGQAITVMEDVEIKADGKCWLHVSVAKPNKKMPTYDDLHVARLLFIGEDRECYQVFPTKDRYVNANNVLHLWCCLDLADGVLPHFEAMFNGSLSI